MALTQLPKAGKKKHKMVLKICQEPGCGKEYVGHPITKYCEYHRKLSNRVRKKKDKVPVDLNNIVLKHKYVSSVTIQRACDCCGKLYTINIIPRQKVYPRYCEEHTNEYRRMLYNKK